MAMKIKIFPKLLALLAALAAPISTHAWERGNALAAGLPNAGAYEFTRSCFVCLRSVLDTAAPQKLAPAPVAVADEPELVHA